MTDEHRQFLQDVVTNEGLQSLVNQKEREIELGLKLYDLRAEAGLTQQTLAKLAGVQQSQISRWESDGIPESTQMDTILRVFSALGADITLRFHREGTISAQVAKSQAGTTELYVLRKAIVKAAGGKDSKATVSLPNGQKVVVKLTSDVKALESEKATIKGRLSAKSKS